MFRKTLASRAKSVYDYPIIAREETGMRATVLMLCFLMIGVCAGTGWCASGQAQKLKIGLLPAADSIVLHVAKDEGLFTAGGLDVELVPFQSALELGAAMRAGELDGQFGDIINVLLHHVSGAPQHLVATTSRSAPDRRYFGLVVPPASRAKSLDDLRGKGVAMASSTIIDFLLDALLTHEGFAPNHLERQDIRQIPVRLQMVMSGQVEAALLPEPLVSLLEARGARTVLTDKGLHGPLAVIALRRAAASPELTARFYGALEEAARRINADPEKCRALMLEKKLLPAPAAQTYVLPPFDVKGLVPPTADEVRVFVDWMLARRMLKDNVEAQSVLGNTAQ